MDRDAYRAEIKRKRIDMSTDKLKLLIFIMEQMLDGAESPITAQNIDAVRQVCAKK